MSKKWYTKTFVRFPTNSEDTDTQLVKFLNSEYIKEWVLLESSAQIIKIVYKN